MKILASRIIIVFYCQAGSWSPPISIILASTCLKILLPPHYISSESYCNNTHTAPVEMHVLSSNQPFRGANHYGNKVHMR